MNPTQSSSYGYRGHNSVQSYSADVAHPRPAPSGQSSAGPSYNFAPSASYTGYPQAQHAAYYTGPRSPTQPTYHTGPDLPSRSPSPVLSSCPPSPVSRPQKRARPADDGISQPREQPREAATAAPPVASTLDPVVCVELARTFNLNESKTALFNSYYRVSSITLLLHLTHLY